MSPFDFVFSLFGLLLGLALAEVLGGFSRAFKARGHVRIGWLTPLLGILVMFDLTSFWISAWSMRDFVPVHQWVLLVVLVHVGLYYVAATLIFPDDARGERDYDEHYFRNSRYVLGAIALANAPSYLVEFIRRTYFSTAFNAGVSAAFLALLAGAMWARSRRLSLMLLLALIALYPAGGLDSFSEDIGKIAAQRSHAAERQQPAARP